MQPTNGPHPMDYYYFTLGQGRQDARAAVERLTNDDFSKKTPEHLADEIAGQIYCPSDELPVFDFHHVDRDCDKIRIPVRSGNPEILEDTGLLPRNDWELQNGAIEISAVGEGSQFEQVRRDLTSAVETGKQQGAEVKRRMAEDILPMVQERKRKLSGS